MGTHCSFKGLSLVSLDLVHLRLTDISMALEFGNPRSFPQDMSIFINLADRHMGGMFEKKHEKMKCCRKVTKSLHQAAQSIKKNLHYPNTILLSNTYCFKSSNTRLSLGILQNFERQSTKKQWNPWIHLCWVLTLSTPCTYEHGLIWKEAQWKCN